MKQTVVATDVVKIPGHVPVPQVGLEAFVTCQCARAIVTNEGFVFKALVCARRVGMDPLAISSAVPTIVLVLGIALKVNASA